MNLDNLYKLQQNLDRHIIAMNKVEMDKEELLDNTILALLVEVGELANTTRCFKHWSKKGMMEKEVILDELADVIHFYLSIGNQIEVKTPIKYFTEYKMEKESIENLTECFNYLFWSISRLDATDISIKYYNKDVSYRVAQLLGRLIELMNFTLEEVEQAYLKKHEENYRRQREGY